MRTINRCKFNLTIIFYFRNMMSKKIHLNKAKSAISKPAKNKELKRRKKRTNTFEN